MTDIARSDKFGDALCALLGIDSSTCIELSITVRANEVVTVKTINYVYDPSDEALDKFAEVIQRYELKPKE